MEDFLRKIKLIDHLSTTVHSTRTEFISGLRNNVEESDINNIFSGFLEVFSTDKKKYKGLVDSKGFHIRKKRKFFEKKHGSVNAKGTFITNGDSLIVNTQINAMTKNQLILMSVGLVCYLTFIGYQFGLDSMKNMFDNIPIFFYIFITLMPLISYFSLKKQVAKMKKDLEEQFNSISSNVSPLK